MVGILQTQIGRTPDGAWSREHRRLVHNERMSNWLERIWRVSSHERVITDVEIDAAEARIGPFPHGYREYASALGLGTLTTWVRVYNAAFVVETLEPWRGRIGEFYFWDAGRAVMARERVLECVCFADTLNGDELVFHPSDPDRILVLPRDFETIFEAGRGLEQALDWLHESGTLTAPLRFRDFEAWVPRRTIRGAIDGGETDSEAAHAAFVRAIEQTGLVDQRRDSPPEEVAIDGLHTTLFSLAIGGSVAVHDGRTFSVRCDVDADTKHLEALRRALASMGRDVVEAEEPMVDPLPLG